MGAPNLLLALGAIKLRYPLARMKLLRVHCNDHAVNIHHYVFANFPIMQSSTKIMFHVRLPKVLWPLVCYGSDYYKMDGQLHCLHCYGHASVRPYSVNVFARQSIVKYVQGRVITSFCVFCKPAMYTFSQFFDFFRLIALFKDRMLFPWQYSVFPSHDSGWLLFGNASACISKSSGHTVIEHMLGPDTPRIWRMTQQEKNAMKCAITWTHYLGPWSFHKTMWYAGDVA